MENILSKSRLLFVLASLKAIGDIAEALQGSNGDISSKSSHIIFEA